MESEAMLMEKPSQEQQQQALKCPRCDSSNTKFCYYNNYSLSQPRHFCKACKRYWTRGGTLRNVPVGGGSRKNKRVKKPEVSTIDGASPATGANTNSSTTPISQPQIDVSSSSVNYVNPLFDLPFPRFKVSGVDTVTGYDLDQPDLSAPGSGLGFSSSYSNMFGSSSSSTTTTTTPAAVSLLDSALYQHKFMNNGGVQSRTEWNVPHQNQLDQIGSSDPTVYWNAPSIGAWHDPASIGSSVTSLI